MFLDHFGEVKLEILQFLKILPKLNESIPD